MATNFPTSLDSLTNPTATSTLSSPSHSAQHADANDAIEALEAKVGVDNSAVTTSLDYRVSKVAGGTAGQVLAKLSATDFDVAWVTRFGFGAGMTAGRWEYPEGTNSTMALVDGRMFLSKIVFYAPVDLDQIIVRVSTGGAAGSVIRLGIYGSDVDMLPDSLVVDAGTVGSETTGNKSIAISESLSPGLYWLACVSQGAPATDPSIVARVGGTVPTLVNAANNNASQAAQGGQVVISGVTGALSTGYAFTSTTSHRPAIGVRIG